MSADHAPPRRLLTFASGGWVFVVAAVLVLAIILWQMTYIIPTLGRPVVGDGHDVDSYGFDLANSIVRRELIAAAGFPRDGLPPFEAVIADPNTVATINRQVRKAHLGKALADKELVIGVEVAGEARAYPKRIMALHEIHADTLGGVPILITYSPLTDSVVVFDRRVAGATLEFGISGLLFNSNTLFYDRTPATGEPEPGASHVPSLWSQLLFRAISGPHAGTALDIVPFKVLPFEAWRALHPTATVALPPDFKRYRKVTYTVYYGMAAPQFPVAPPPPAGGPDGFDRVFAVREPDGAGWIAAPLDLMSQVGDPASQYRVATSAQPPAAWVIPAVTNPDIPEPIIIPSLWFAWYAMHGESTSF